MSFRGALITIAFLAVAQFSWPAAATPILYDLTLFNASSAQIGTGVLQVEGPINGALDVRDGPSALDLTITIGGHIFTDEEALFTRAVFLLGTLNQIVYMGFDGNTGDFLNLSSPGFVYAPSAGQAAVGTFQASMRAQTTTITSVPEPACLALIGAALVGLTASRRRAPPRMRILKRHPRGRGVA